MNKLTLFFKSLCVITVVVGSAHFVSYISHRNELDNSSLLENKKLPESNEFKIPKKVDSVYTYEENTHLNSNHNGLQTNLTSISLTETDYIIGKWMVEYDNKDFKGSIIYEIKKENSKYNAYTLEYWDEFENSEKAEKTKVLRISDFDGYKGKGLYIINYEKYKYDIECVIRMLDMDTFILSYSYYNQDYTETFNRLK